MSTSNNNINRPIPSLSSYTSGDVPCIMYPNDINVNNNNISNKHKLIQCGACFRSFHTQAQFGQHSRICREGKAVIRHLIQSQSYKYSYLEKQIKQKLEVKSRFVIVIAESMKSIEWKKISRKYGLYDGAIRKLLKLNNINNVDIAIRQRKASGLIIANFIVRNVIQNANAIHNAKISIQNAVKHVRNKLPKNIKMRLHLCKSRGCNELVIRDTEGFCSRHRAQKYHKKSNQKYIHINNKNNNNNNNNNNDKQYHGLLNHLKGTAPPPPDDNNHNHNNDNISVDTDHNEEEHVNNNEPTDDELLVARLLTNLKSYSDSINNDMYHSDFNKNKNNKNNAKTNKKRTLNQMNNDNDKDSSIGSSASPSPSPSTLDNKLPQKKRRRKKHNNNDNNNNNDKQAAQVYIVPVPCYQVYDPIAMTMAMNMNMNNMQYMPMSIPMQMGRIPYSFVPVMPAININNNNNNNNNITNNLLMNMNMNNIMNNNEIPSIPVIPTLPLLNINTNKTVNNNNNNNTTNNTNDDDIHSQSTNNSIANSQSPILQSFPIAN